MTRPSIAPTLLASTLASDDLFNPDLFLGYVRAALPGATGAKLAEHADTATRGRRVHRASLSRRPDGSLRLYVEWTHGGGSAWTFGPRGALRDFKSNA